MSVTVGERDGDPAVAGPVGADDAGAQRAAARGAVLVRGTARLGVMARTREPRDAVR